MNYSFGPVLVETPDLVRHDTPCSLTPPTSTPSRHPGVALADLTSLRFPVLEPGAPSRLSSGVTHPTLTRRHCPHFPSPEFA